MTDIKRPYIDLHCDTLMIFAPRSEKTSLEPSLREADRPDLYDHPSTMIDIKRLVESGAGAQFFATFMPPSDRLKCSDETYRSALYDGFVRTVNDHPELLGFAKSYSDYLSNKKAGRLSAFLTFEDARMVEGSFDNLRLFYRLGYRLLTLTWNYANCFGFPCSAIPSEMEKGLTPFGKEAVELMNELGMIVDVSHLSDGGFLDVADISKKPFVASHSCCRDLNPHHRNLTDPMIRRLAESGGFVGMNFCPEFCGDSPEDKVSTVAHICDHIEHLINVGGLELVGLGSDFDGIDGTLEVSSPCDMQKIFKELKRRGYSRDALDKIAYKNAERLLKDTL